MLCLTTSTDPAWARLAIADLPRLLADHAHCEMKAAANALSLAARLPHLPRVARALAALAKEEIDHFDAVLAELAEREVTLPPPAVDPYAAALRKLMRKEGAQEEPRATQATKDAGHGNQRRARRSTISSEDVIVDRLLVAALIEARSCERLGLLAEALAGAGEARLAAFYKELFASEARHYRTFVDLAIEVAGPRGDVQGRLAALAAAEGSIAATLGNEATVHG